MGLWAVNHCRKGARGQCFLGVFWGFFDENHNPHCQNYYIYD